MTVRELYSALDDHNCVNVGRAEEHYKHLNDEVVVYSPCGPGAIESLHVSGDNNVVLDMEGETCPRILTSCNYIDKIETYGYIIRTKDGKYVGIDDSTDGYVTTFFPHPFVQGEYKYVIQFDCPESAMRFCKENNIVDYVILKRGTFQYVDEDLT